MGRRADPELVAKAQLIGAERLLADIEDGLLLGRDVQSQRARVAELEALVGSHRP